MSGNSEETEATRETHASSHQQRWGVVRAFLVMRVRSLARQSKLGVILGFGLLFFVWAFVVAVLLRALPLPSMLLVILGIILLVPPLWGVELLLDEAGVICRNG